MTYQEQLSKAIYNIAAAYFILHSDISLGPVNILPDWLGYIFILNALPIIGEEEPSITLLRPLCLVLIVWEGAKWLAVIVGFLVNVELLGLIATLVQLYLHFQLLTNLAEVALQHDSVQIHENLLIYRTLRTLILTALYLLMPWTETSYWLNIVMIIVYLLIGLLICRDLFHLSGEIRKEKRQ